MTTREQHLNVWRRLISSVPEGESRLKVFREAAFDTGRRIGTIFDHGQAVDDLIEMARAHSFFGLDQPAVEVLIGEDLKHAADQREDDADREKLYAEADEKAARARSNGKEGDQRKEPPLDCEPWWRDAKTITPRAFLYGKHFQRKSIGASIGAGGRLKTSHGLFEAVEMAVGRKLSRNAAERVEISAGPLRAAFLSAEEDQDELDRRLAAICQYYSIGERDLGGRLFAISVCDQPLRFATIVRGVSILNQPAFDRFADFVRRKQLDVWMLDPWVSFHSVRESENADMDLVIKDGLKRIAVATNSAGEIFHHPGKPKPGHQETTVEDARGASAIIYAVRSARVFNFMTSDEAAKLGISESERRGYVRITNGKANMGPIGQADWLKIEVENLPNGEEVACSTLWKPPNAFDGLSVLDMQGGAKLAQGGAFRADPQSPDWYGWALAEQLHIPVACGADNDPKDIARLKTIIKIWLKNKVLKIAPGEDEHRKPRLFIVPGASYVGREDACDNEEVMLQ